MKARNTFLSSTLFLAVSLTACGGGAAPDAMAAAHDTATADAMSMAHDTATAEAARMTHATPTADAMPAPGTGTPEAMMPLPGWFSAALTEVRTGQSFRVSDYKGKVLLIETMAVWCSKCRSQQEQIKALHARMGANADFISLSLDIDPNEDMRILKTYLESTGFDWMYAVASADVVREIGLTYGDQFLNPPSTPILIIDRHGEAHPLPFGIKSADELKSALQPYLDQQ